MTQELTPEQQKEFQEKLKNMSPEELDALRKQQNIFYQIAQGNVPAKKVYEDDICIAILDINPAARGHLVLFPKEPYMIMPQVPENVLVHLISVTKKLSQALLKSMKATGTTIFIANGQAAGQRAQQFIIHIIPRKEGDGLFNVEEKLVGKDIVEKARSVIEGKLNELLGVDKVIVTSEKEEDDDETEEEIDPVKLPAAVKKAIKKNYPGAKIKEAEKETEDGEVVYEVELILKDGSEIEVEFSPKGEIIEVEDSDEDDDDTEEDSDDEVEEDLDDDSEDDTEEEDLDDDDDEEEASLDDIADLFT